MAYTKEGVKYFTSYMQGAPALTNATGGMIAVLDACLKDGFGLLAVSSLVVSGGVATMTITSGHQYKQWSVLQIAGVTGALAALNAQWKNKAVTATTVVWDCPGVPDGTASGSITAKVAPLGWTKVFGTSTKAVYRSSDPLSAKHLLRLDDTVNATTGRVRAYESMPNVDDGLNEFPTFSQMNLLGGGNWPKTQTATAKQWCLIGDERFFYWHTTNGSGTGGGWGCWFGEPVTPPNVSDPFSTAIMCTSADHSNEGTTFSGGELTYCSVNSFQNTSGDAWLARYHTGLGGSAPAGWGPMLSYGGHRSGGSDAPLAFPSPLGFNIYVAQVAIWTPGIIRGYLPGLGWIPQQTVNIGNAFSQYQLVDSISGWLAGRTCLMLGSGNNSGPSDAYQRAMVDIIGPWRT